ncbi:MAG: cation:proton antiporter [Terrimicrobiaceae bacterium]
MDFTLPSYVVWTVGALLSAGFLMAFWRLVVGPGLPDRVVAVDAMATVAVGALVLTAMATNQPLLLDIALAIALITFLGTIALAASIEKGIFK